MVYLILIAIEFIFILFPETETHDFILGIITVASIK